MSKNIKPFLKWVGGKDKLIPQIKEYYPKELLNNEIETYIEPFIGGGSHFIYLIQNFTFKKVIISDINQKLINVYNQIKISSNDLINNLENYKLKYFSYNEEERKIFYNDLRNKFNSNNLEGLEEATIFILLNKLCFNGLYRLNSKGGFNVPIGKYKNPSIYDKENILKLSNKLKNVEIYNESYLECENRVSGKTFIYFDPPYRPINKTSNFTSYSNEGFNETDQINLSLLYKRLDYKKVKLMLSNSYSEDGFFQNIYKDYNLNIINAKRSINSNKDKRGKINELLITNYE